MTKLYWVKTNAYNMLLSDDGDVRHYLVDCDDVRLYEHEGSEYEYLTTVMDDTTWDDTYETVDELTRDSEIIAEHISNDL